MRVLALLLGAGVASAALLAACSGDGKSSAPPPSQAPAREARAADLPLMPLPQEELGSLAAGLEVDSGSGPQDNAEAAEDSFDPNDTAGSLAEAGRLAGYDLAYSDPQLVALENGEGLTSIGSGLDLYSTSEQASAAFKKLIDDFTRLAGSEIESGVTLSSAEKFDVADLGDEAAGLRGTATFAGVTQYQTAVGFRTGRLVGSVYVAAADDVDHGAAMKALARKLEQRMRGVLEGTVTGEPVPLPEPVETGESGAFGPPPGGPDLSTMALALDDLPEGVSVAREEYVQPDDTLAEYEREFEVPATTPLGRSGLLSLESDVEVYESPGFPSVVLRTLPGVFTGPGSESFLKEQFVSGSGGLEASSVDVKRLPSSGLGDQAQVFGATFVTNAGTFDSIFAFFRVDRAVGTLIAMSTKGSASWQDIRPLAETQVQRMREALPPAD